MFRLAPSVHAAIDGDWLIFLDLGRNRYLATDACVARCLLEFSDGAPDHPDCSQMLSSLRMRGLVEADSASPTPQLQHSAPRRMPIQTSAPIQFIRAAMWAGSIVRRGALLEAVSALRIWKQNAGARNLRGWEDARLFAALRLWYPAKYICLFDALCLSRFLLMRGVLVDFVIGVRARPFFAHSWVEIEHEIVDEAGEDCRAACEILRI